MKAEKPERTFLHMAGKTGNGSILMGSNLAILAELQLHRLSDSAVRGRREPFTLLNVNQET